MLVEDKHGEPFSDGKRYTKFYVPETKNRNNRDHSRSEEAGLEKQIEVYRRLVVLARLKKEDDLLQDVP